MTGLDFFHRLEPVIEELAKEPRFSLAWLLAYARFDRLIYALGDEKTFEKHFTETLEALRAEIKDLRAAARSRAQSKRIKRILEDIDAGRFRPARRRRRRKVRA